MEKLVFAISGCCLRLSTALSLSVNYPTFLLTLKCPEVGLKYSGVCVPRHGCKTITLDPIFSPELAPGTIWLHSYVLLSMTYAMIRRSGAMILSASSAAAKYGVRLRHAAVGSVR